MRFVDMLKNDGFTDNRITVIEHEGLTATSFGITWAKNEGRSKPTERRWLFEMMLLI